MKARELLYHFQEVGTWVDWRRTCDRLLHGDPDSGVSGIATAWIPTDEAIRQAHSRGLNLFISHEDVFPRQYEGTPSGDEVIGRKRALLDDFGITVIRCHDTWDRMPQHGIPDAWASFLGFRTEDRPVESFYKVCLLDGVTVERAASLILEKVRSLGQDTVLVFGDIAKHVERMAVGTGAITHLPTMHSLGADALLATDDGINTTNGGLWSADLGVPVLVVNHATAEKPGMQAMAKYLGQRYPGVPVEYIDVEFPYTSVRYGLTGSVAEPARTIGRGRSE